MEKLPLLIGFVVMSIGSLAIYVRGSKDLSVRHHTQVHSLVPMIAATSYLAMYLGNLLVTRGDGVLVYVPRYIDWTFTTPLLLSGLTMVALHEHSRIGGYLTAVIGADVIMIAAGLMAALSNDGGQRLAWYLWSCAAFAGVIFLLWGPLRARSKHYGGKLDEVYKSNTTYLTVVWFLYPVVFAVGPEGLGILSAAFSVWAILILDIVAKVIYGFVVGGRIEAALPEMRQRDRQDA